MYTKWNEASLAKYDNKVKNLLSSLTPSVCSVHIGTSNRKTKMVNEGTSAGLCGTCDKSCKGDCREGCYAIVHGDGVYATSRKNHAENTIMRRHNRIAYYKEFFEYAKNHEMHLRVNETGDFECAEDISALLFVATSYPMVRVIGYTKRANLVPFVAELNKLKNVKIHFSLGCSAILRSLAENYGVPTAEITFDAEKVNCPNQIAKIKGKVWNCENCAKNKCGCFSQKNILFLAH